MELVQKTLNDLINDKNEVIESQNIIIEAFKDCHDPDLVAEMKEARNIIAQRKLRLSL